VNKYLEESRAVQRARERYNMCDRKRAFPTEAAAFQKGQTSYLCPHCNAWHRSGSLSRLVAFVKRTKPKQKRVKS
jgi:hypothetical protein